jgi:hypothetical protein
MNTSASYDWVLCENCGREFVQLIETYFCLCNSCFAENGEPSEEEEAC